MSTIAEKLVEINENVDKNQKSGKKKGIEEALDMEGKFLDLLHTYQETFINGDEEERVRVEALLDEELEKFRKWEQQWTT